MRTQREQIRKEQNKMIQSAVNRQKVDDWLKGNVAEQLERLMNEYMEHDPEQGSPVSTREFAERKRILIKKLLTKEKKEKRV
jgi:hypothetical protein